jgi:activator of HSP90 ATPase
MSSTARRDRPWGSKRHLKENQAVTDIKKTLGTAVHQEIDLPAAPDRVYEALLDERQFAAFSGAPASIERRPGGAFSLVGGRVRGRNVELVPNQRIVQAWQVAPWSEDTYSIARFVLHAQGGGTRLVLDHTGFPPEDVEARAAGWHRFYWGPLQQYLARERREDHV